MQRYIVIHYGEIALKGGNRQFFEKKLAENITKALASLGRIWLKRLYGRFIVKLEDNWDLDEVKEKLCRVFGIEYFALAWQSASDIKEIEKDLLALLKKVDFKKFRLTVRRTNKNFPLNSQEICERLGALIVKKMSKKVDLENFDLNCHLDIINDFVFIYFDKIACRGGLPVGVSGKLLSLLSGGIDSPVAANLMQKRGAKIVYVNFDAYPATPKENQEKVKDLVKILNEYQFDSKLYLVPFLEIQKQILQKAPENYRVIFYRRMMLRIAQEISEQENILALITGESLGQVASQTIENIRVISQAISSPILRPLIGFDKEDIINIAKTIGTYETSIQPFNDCCSLYLPKHPATRADLNIVLEFEKKLDFQKLIDSAVKQTEIIKF